MKVLGFIHIYFYFYTINSNNYTILLYSIDSVIDYDFKRNTEVVKWEGNIVNGIIGMKRDTNLESLEFFHSYEDIKEVFL
jgi:hypothetical protein